jgi:hypothetical protein
MTNTNPTHRKLRTTVVVFPTIGFWSVIQSEAFSSLRAPSGSLITAAGPSQTGLGAGQTLSHYRNYEDNALYCFNRQKLVCFTTLEWGGHVDIMTVQLALTQPIKNVTRTAKSKGCKRQLNGSSLEPCPFTYCNCIVGLIKIISDSLLQPN